jgi:cohesin complex subunit SA-1/2
MLDLYVLFSPINAVDQEGAPLPTALVPLTLDDEIQYRCAGYMQAEIERYAELVSETEDKKQPGEKESGSESEDSTVEKPQKAKKQPAQTTKNAEKESTLLVLVDIVFLIGFDSGYPVSRGARRRISVH